jgi:hypothetical protein
MPLLEAEAIERASDVRLRADDPARAVLGSRP